MGKPKFDYELQFNDPESLVKYISEKHGNLY